jgi:hypothetical protein
MTEEKRMKREQSWNGDRYRDERLFVMNLTKAQITIDDGTPVRDKKVEYKWVIETHRNNFSLSFFNSKTFDTKHQAIKYIKDVEPTVPLIMPFGEAALDIPEGEDRWEYWLWWLKKRGLFSALTELQHMPFWAEPRGFGYRKDYVKIEKIAPKKEYIN